MQPLGVQCDSPIIQGILRGASFAAGIGIATAIAATLTSFSAGQTISSSAMNANFQALNSELSDLRAALDELRGERSMVRFGGRSYSLGGVFVGGTALAVQGNLGLVNAKRACETMVGSVSAHMCTVEEMVRSKTLGMNVGGVGWIISGTTDSVSANGVDDCHAWTSNDNARRGAVWDGANEIYWHRTCGTTLPIFCCD